MRLHPDLIAPVNEWIAAMMRGELEDLECFWRKTHALATAAEGLIVNAAAKNEVY